MSKPIMPTGIYLHFKGGHYNVIDVVRHSETDEWLVLYHPVNAPQPLWVRPLGMFNETVEHNGEQVRRFRLETD